MNIFDLLYFALVGEFNFDAYIKDPNDTKWMMWQEDLSEYSDFILKKVIVNIKKGQLHDSMKKTQIFPTLGDIKRMCRTEKRLSNLDKKAQNAINKNQLGHERVYTTEVIRESIELAKNEPVGYHDDFDKERLRLEGRVYMDLYISRKSGRSRATFKGFDNDTR